MRNTTSPAFRDYFPECTDNQLVIRQKVLRRELLIRHIERNESLESTACRRLIATLDDIETTWAYRKLNNIKRR